jgi:hypothetical protein
VFGKKRIAEERIETIPIHEKILFLYFITPVELTKVCSME